MKNILLSLFSAVLILVVLEFIVSVFFPAPVIEPISVMSNNGEHVLSMNKDLIYVPNPSTGLFNAKGYRGDEFSYDRNDRKRIIFIGDSVVEGWSVDGNKRFSYLLDSEMDDYEIVNLGVMGYNLKQEIEYLKQEGLKYDPDIVLFFITFNDLEMHAGEIEWLSDEIGDNPLYSAYYKRGVEQKLLSFDIYRYFFLFKSRFFKPEAFNESVYYKIDHVDGLLKELVSLSSSEGFKLGFVFLPLPSSTSSLQMEKIKDNVDEMGIKSLDLYSNMVRVYGQEYVDSLFFDACHLNEQGHEFISSLLYENIYGFISYIEA